MEESAQFCFHAGLIIKALRRIELLGRLPEWYMAARLKKPAYGMNDAP